MSRIHLEKDARYTILAATELLSSICDRTNPYRFKHEVVEAQIGLSKLLRLYRDLQVGEVVDERLRNQTFRDASDAVKSLAEMPFTNHTYDIVYPFTGPRRHAARLYERGKRPWATIRLLDTYIRQGKYR